MIRNSGLKMAAVPVLLLVSLLPGCNASAAPANHDSLFSALAANSYTEAEDLVGTWIFQTGDAGASYRITLELRADGTYTKTLETNVSVGGTHSGTWSNRGSVVYLSGDGNWPASSHDLAKFHRVS